MLADDHVRLVTRMLEVIERDVVPLTRAGVARGDKVFGAAILAKSDGGLVVAGTNEETDCPLWHGEISAIRRFHEIPSAGRPAPEECLFLSTHEPCSLCLSAITWAGFDNFHYLFSYEDSRDDFDIPHDLNILDEVFSCSDGAYSPVNAYWTSYDLIALIEEIDPTDREKLLDRVTDLRRTYAELSDTYQGSKEGNEIPLG